MKRFYTIALLIASPFIGFSQSVISNVVPGFGDQFVLSQGDDAPSPGSAGANITWDFSNEIITEYSSNYTVMLPSEVEGSDEFPDATMVWVTSLEDMILASYMGFDNNTFTEYGTKSEASGFSFGTNYSDPIDHFTYPLSYQNTGSDTYSGTVFGIGTSNTISGTESYVVDGWGTIMTPFGTFENVLRITFTSVETLETTLTMLTNRTETMWYSPDYPVPVMIFMSDYSSIMGMPTDSSKSMTALVSYSPASTTGLAERDNRNAFDIYPNPASEHITVAFDHAKANAVLYIYSSAGKLVETKSGVQSDQKVDVSSLAPGIYIGVLSVDGQQYAQRPFSIVE